jgi:hypothetical protein
VTFSGRCVKRPRYLWQGGSAAPVVQPPAGKALTVRTAAESADQSREGLAHDLSLFFKCATSAESEVDVGRPT